MAPDNVDIQGPTGLVHCCSLLCIPLLTQACALIGTSCKANIPSRICTGSLVERAGMTLCKTLTMSVQTQLWLAPKTEAEDDGNNAGLQPDSQQPGHSDLAPTMLFGRPPAFERAFCHYKA